MSGQFPPKKLSVGILSRFCYLHRRFTGLINNHEYLSLTLAKLSHTALRKSVTVQPIIVVETPGWCQLKADLPALHDALYNSKYVGGTSCQRCPGNTRAGFPGKYRPVQYHLSGKYWEI